VLILVAGIGIAVVVALWGMSLFGHETFAVLSAAISAALGIALGIVGIINRITLEVDAQGVNLGYWPIWKVRMSRDDLEKLTPAVLDPAMFGGLGLWRMPGKKWGLLLSGGPGLIATRKSDRATFCVRTDHADEAIAAFRGNQPGVTLPS
jgi:hypothetical protein